MSFSDFEFWFVTGAQLLYGGDAVVQVDKHSKEIVDGLNNSKKLPVKVVYKGTANSSKEVLEIFKNANNDEKCAGVITWMHTFSPAKMWIHGLQQYNKPLLHLHTQYNAEIPWDKIDMDFMNLNQSAHGDREFGHICARMRIPRKIVTGHWKDPEVLNHINVWMRVSVAVADAKNLVIIRIGDNMNNVAVTDGDKVEAEKVLGYHVDYYGIGELVKVMETVTQDEINKLLAEYDRLYDVAPDCKEGGKFRKQVVEAAREELAIRKFLKEKNAKCFVSNFDELHGFDQLPGLASQRLMAEGYGFGAEGDWKTAALVRALWVMRQDQPGGSSFLEDYTLNFDGAKTSILESHMLEVCPLIAENKPKLEVHPLGIGGKNDPARLVFTSKQGPGVAATIVDVGNRFRMIVNEVDCIKSKPLPKLPVASALWIPRPNFEIGASAWIIAGGTHHSAFSYDLNVEYFEDYAEILGIELAIIDGKTTIRDFKQQLRTNEVYYMLHGALK